MGVEFNIDQQLWESFRKGDQKAFRKLYDKYQNTLIFFGLRYCQSKPTVEDCIQDLFVDLYHYRSKLSNVSNVRYYLLKSLRRRIAKATSIHNNKNQINEDHNYEFYFEYSIEARLIMDEQEAQLYQLVKKELELLPRKQKEALYLRFTESLSYEEISGLMDINQQSVRMQVYRAIKAIRENIQKVYKVEHISLFVIISSFLQGVEN